MNTRLCHSVWTKPMLKKRWDVAGQLESNLWLFALSVAYAKRLGCEIVLHTDQLGREVYGFLPYDKVYPTLDTLNVHERFWAAGKIFAQEAEPLGSVHIDGDVFIKKPDMLPILDLSHHDLVTQFVEDGLGCVYEHHFHMVLSAIGDAVPEFNRYQSSAYNCGVVGFGSQELKARYIQGYKEMLSLCSQNHDFVKRIDGDLYLAPDLVIEQLWLKSLCDYRHASAKEVLDYRGNINEQANSIGFAHIIGRSKYDKIPQVKRRLLEVAPSIFVKVSKQIKKLKSNGN